VEGIDVLPLSVELIVGVAVGVDVGETSAEGLDSPDVVVSPDGEAVMAGIELSPAAKTVKDLAIFCIIPSLSV